MFHLLLLLFLYLYLAVSQADVVHYLCSLPWGEPVAFRPKLTALLLVVLYAFILWGVRRLFAPRKVGKLIGSVAVCWLTAALLSAPFAGWAWQLGLLLVALLLVGADWRWNLHLLRRWGAGRNRWQKFMPRAVELLVLFLYVGLGTSVSDTDHYELRTARALRSSRPQEAYEVGTVHLAASSRLFALRSYLLATTQPRGLGDKIFQQPIPAGGSAQLLFPRDDRQRLLFSPDSLTRLLGSERRPGEPHLAYFRRCAEQARQQRPTTVERPLAPIDYYLCALLIDRRLDAFALEVNRYYPHLVATGRLPFYYAQALVLHGRQHSHPVVRYRDAAIEANFRDYTEMGDTLREPTPRRNLLRRSYGETYWWWYDYGQSGTAQP